MDLALGYFSVFFGLFVRVYCMFNVIRPVRVQLGQLAMLVFAVVLALWLMGFENLAEASSLSSVVSIGNLALLVIGNAAVGLVFGMPAAIVAELMPMSGRLIDMCRGAQFSEQLLPGSAERTSILEQCALLLVPVFVFAAGGYKEICLLLGQASQSLPADPARAFMLFQFNELILLSMAALRTAVLIGAPCIMTCLVVDLSVALLSRCLGRVNMVFEALPLKVVGGLLTVWLILHLGSSVVIFAPWRDAWSTSQRALVEHSGISANAEDQQG